MERVLRESPSTRASSSSARMAYSTTEGPHRKEGGAFHISGPTSQETPDASVAGCLSPLLRASSVTLPTSPRPAKPCPLSFVSADLRHYLRLTLLWNILRRVKHRGAHHGRFHSPRRFWTARVRRKGAGAHGTSPNGLTGESTSADRRA